MKVGKKKRRRPKRRWRDCIREDLAAAGVTEENAADRRKWKQKIRTGDPTRYEKSQEEKKKEKKKKI